MSLTSFSSRIDRPVDPSYDHILGPPTAEITLVEYGSYACPHCRAANDLIASVRDRFGDRVRYVFRHRPVPNNELAQQAAELVELAKDNETFWEAHVALMTRSGSLTEDDLQFVRETLDLGDGTPDGSELAAEEARERVEADAISARRSGVTYTPTFFINGRRYEGPWDSSSLSEAMLDSLGHRVRAAALDFVRWGPSTGVLLLIATLSAIFLMNSAFGATFERFWTQPFGFVLGGSEFGMSVRHWVNDGLLTIFFLVVGLEIKREFTVGRLSSRRSGAFPIAAAFGGMTIPVLLYLWFAGPTDWAHGWGITTATDTAFAIALIVALGKRVPVELRIFLTAAAIADDIVAILIVAVFYSSSLNVTALMAAGGLTLLLFAFNRIGVYRALPYVVCGILLWAAIHVGGLHATLAGVILALLIPTRPPADFSALMIQANSIMTAETARGDKVLRHGPSAPALETLDAIHDRIESPASRTLRNVEPWSSYLVLPVFALANAGVALSMGVIEGHGALIAAIMAGLVVGKPIGFLLMSWLAVKLGIAAKPKDYSWLQLAGAGAMAGIGFTMSLFIAGQAFPDPAVFAAAKIAVFSASVIAAILGMGILMVAKSPEDEAA